MKRKWLLLLIVVTFICQSCLLISAGEEAVDSETEVQAEEVQITQKAEALIYLGFLEENVKMDASVNRGELAQIMLKVYAPNLIPDAFLGNYCFTDVQEGSPYADAVYTAYTAKLMNGYGGDYFGAIENATVNQTVAVLVNALGYTALAEKYGAYPQGYQMAANFLDLPIGNLNWNDEITMEQLADLVYSAVQIDRMRPVTVGDVVELDVIEGDTTLSQMHIGTAIGQVTALEGYSITDVGGVSEKYVAIDRMPFAIDDFEVGPDVVGRTVEYFYRADDDGDTLTLLYLFDRSERYELLDLSKKDISVINEDFIRYYDENDREQTIQLERDINVVYNRKFLSTLEYTQINSIPFTSLRVIGREGEWQTLIIENAIPALAASVSADGSTLYLLENTKFEGMSSVQLINNEIRDFNCVIYKNNDRQSADIIQKYNVLEIMKSMDGTSLTIYVSDQTVTGTITAVGGKEYLLVEDKEYSLSSDAVFMNTDNMNAVLPDGPTVMLSGDFYFNRLGEIVFARVSLSGKKYAYLRAYSESQGISDDIQIDIFTEDGGWQIMNAKENLEVDGEVISRSELPSILDRIPQDQRLVKYKTDANGELIFLDTVILGSDENEETMNCFMTGHTTNMDYYQGYNIDNIPYKIWDNTKILVVPADKKDKDLYRFVDRTFFEYNHQYTIDIYNISESMIIGAVVIDGGSAEDDYEEYPSIIKNVSKSLSDDGLEVSKWTVTTPSGNTAIAVKSVLASADYEEDNNFFEYAYEQYRGIKTLQPGDVVKFRLDERGNVVKIKFYFRPSDPPPYGILNHKVNDEYGYGKILVKDEQNNFLVLQQTDTLTSDDDKVAYWLRVIVVYNSKNDSVALANISELNEDENAFVIGNLGHVDMTMVVR